MEEKRLFDILKLYIAQYPNQDVALARKEKNKWVKYSIQEYVETTNYLSYAFIKLGIQKNDKVGIICSNRPASRSNHSSDISNDKQGRLQIYHK